MSVLPSGKITASENALLSLDLAQLELFRAQTGLGEEALKDHIKSIQTKAYQVVSYPCIKSFNFLRCLFLSCRYSSTQLSVVGLRCRANALIIGPCNSLKTGRTPFCLMLGVAVCFLLLLRQRILDFGHLVGCDLRKAVADGWPVENVIGFDIHTGKY